MRLRHLFPVILLLLGTILLIEAPGAHICYANDPTCTSLPLLFIAAIIVLLVSLVSALVLLVLWLAGGSGSKPKTV